MRHPNVAARVFHTPLLAAPAKAAAFIMGFGPRITGVEVEVEGAAPTPEASVRARASLLDDRLEDDLRAGRRAGYRTKDGVAVIPVTGTLVHRGAWLGQSSGETSYEGLAAQIETAASDPYVRGVALEIDSFGGEVAGCFSLADQIRALRADKPVWAFVSDHAYSAGYAVASQADRVILPRTAGVGSIGVIAMHADFSGRLETVGVRVTVIAAGDHKSDGNPYEPLPESVRESLQAEMEKLRLIFAETVGAGRGAALDAAGALATEAGTFIGADAVEAGLADEVANPREAFERFVAQVNGRQASAAVGATSKRNFPMSDKPTNPVEPAPTAAVPEPAAPAAGAPEPATPPQGPSAADERARISAILNHPEAAGREDLAKSLAFESDMSAEQAGRHLAAAPKASPQQSLSASMDAEATELEAPGPSGAAAEPTLAQRARERWAS
ncbi:S49 family peptidase [Roseivivax isoporae]|uniref:Serine protease n=1 Tax=Roseivivax isoporae LMG 25204 TaxID=1449351 RepID=X7F459_9RHOB|nr:S49 family peptidase [Roseivivax isoporae]ETX26859.1 serine protease [Roseivivax isoporae LMG 25204]